MPERTLKVVCAPEAWALLAPLVTSREAQGFSVARLAWDALPTLADAAPGHVLLVGHPCGSGPLRMPTQIHPPAYRHMASEFHGDHALVHGALRAAPVHAVGRLPARTPEALERMVRKVTATPPAPPRVIHFLDGDPKWGVAINTVCDRLAGWCARSDFARGYEVLRTSFNPVTRGSRADAARCLTHGAALWIYVGHGQRHSVDGLDVAAVTLLDGGASLPLALMACCHAGAFDAEDPALAETWMASAGGPRAVVAGSNVTDPRLNPALALALAQAALKPGMTAGEAFLLAQRAVLGAPTAPWAAALRMAALPGLRRAHAGLYNLLGDPSMLLRPDLSHTI